MNFKFNKKYLTVAVYSLAVITFGLLFFLLCYNFEAVGASLAFVLSKTQGVFYGVIFALTLAPLYSVFIRLYSKIFEKKKARRRTVTALSIVCTYLVTFIIIGIVILGFIPFVSSDFEVLRDSIPDYVDRVRSWFESELGKSSIIREYYDELIKFLDDSLTDFFTNFNSYLPQIIGVISGVVGEVSDIVIGFILSIYFLISRRNIGGILNKILVAILPIKAAQQISGSISRLYRNVMAYISTRLLDSLIVGILCYFFTWIFGIPFFSVLSIAVFILNIIPVFGPIIGISLASIVVALAAPSKLVILLIVLFSLLILDRLLFEPLLIRRSLRPNIGLSIVILIVGWQLLGFVGLFLAIPIYATLAFEFKKFIYYMLRRKGLYEDPKYDVVIPEPSDEYHEQRSQLLSKWTHVIHMLDRGKTEEDSEEDIPDGDEDK